MARRTFRWMASNSECFEIKENPEDPRGNDPYGYSSGKIAEAQDHRWEQKSTGFGRNIKTPDIQIYSDSHEN